MPTSAVRRTAHRDEHRRAARPRPRRPAALRRRRCRRRRTPAFTARSPITGEDLFDIAAAGAADVEAAIAAAKDAFAPWRTVPAPVPRRAGQAPRRAARRAQGRRSPSSSRSRSARSASEALGEVQEMIDICDFAVGLSRQLDGRTMPSERPGHRLMETWHPLGVVGVISAFNFPAAVWSWNTASRSSAATPWSGSPRRLTPLTAAGRAPRSSTAPPTSSAPRRTSTCSSSPMPTARPGARRQPRRRRWSAPPARSGWAPQIAPARRRPLRQRPPGARRQQRRHRRAVGRPRPRRARHRLRRRRHRRPALHHHAPPHRPRGRRRRARRSGSPASTPACRSATRSPTAPSSGPLIDANALRVDAARPRPGGRRRRRARSSAATGATPRGHAMPYYVEPAIVRMPAQTESSRTETFAPILYVLTYGDFEEAIALHNDVPQGLSSCDLHHATSGRPSASSPPTARTAASSTSTSARPAPRSAARSAARRRPAAAANPAPTPGGPTCAAPPTPINYSDELPLAQGVTFA